MIKKTIIFLSAVLSAFVYSQEFPLIEKVTTLKDTIVIEPNAELGKLFLMKEFLVQYENIDVDLTKLDYSIVTIPFVLHAIPIIWQQNKTYVIEKMDSDLYYSLEKIKKVFRLFYRNVDWCGTLRPKKLVKNSYMNAHEYEQNKQSVIIPFSCGVDSMYNSLATIDKKQLLVTICGADIALANNDLWLDFKKYCQDYALKYNVPLCSVRSNFAGFYDGNKDINHPLIWTKTSQGLSYTSLMIPLMVAKGIPFCLIGSASVVELPWPYGSHPLIEHNLNIAGCYSFHFGAELTRTEKIGKIMQICTDHELPKPSLRVCRSTAALQNCGHCLSKCLVTMACLMVEGYNHNEHGFDVPVEEMIERTSATMATKKLDHDGAWKWRFLQKRIRDFKQSGKQYLPEITPFIEWLENLDLEPFVDETKPCKYSPEVTAYLSSLWAQSMDVANARFRRLFPEGAFANR